MRLVSRVLPLAAWLAGSTTACHADIPIGDIGEAGADGLAGDERPFLGGPDSSLCPAQSPTTISGTVYDPAGNDPLYNIAVYIPADPASLPPLPGPPGALVSCPQCRDYYPT